MSCYGEIEADLSRLLAEKIRLEDALLRERANMSDIWECPNEAHDGRCSDCRRLTKAEAAEAIASRDAMGEPEQE